MRILVVAFVVGVTGCSGDDAPRDAPMRCPLGDMSAPAQLEIVHLDAASNVVVTQPDMQIPLLAPPQGGWIVLLGARATNIDGCRVTLTTSFRDVCGTSVIGLDRRPTQLEDTGDGWGRTEINSYGNLPICPQAIATRDLHGQPYDMTVELEDTDGKQASKTIRLTPVCPDPDPSGLCLCQCDHNYVLGGACPPGGADAGVCP